MFAHNTENGQRSGGQSGKDNDLAGPGLEETEKGLRIHGRPFGDRRG